MSPAAAAPSLSAVSHLDRSPERGSARAQRLRARVVGAGVVALVLVLYAPTLGHPFLTYSDPAYVTSNLEVLGGLSVDNVRWAFSSTSGDSWHPVTWLSHMLDIELHGEVAGRHHATSAMLHALNALLLFATLYRLTGATWRSGLAAGLFAIHPVHAESVAWVSAREDLLSGGFALLALYLHASHAKTARPATRVAVAIAFALGLAAKPVLVTWPLVLLLVDVWPLRRIGEAGIWPLAWEKSFLLTMAFASCVVTVALVGVTGATSDLADLSIGERAANAFVSYVRYLGKLFWPTDLAILYPHPQGAGGTPWAAWQVVASALVLAAVTTAAVWWRRRAPYLLLGWLWFVVMLLPVIGLVQIGHQAMADRFAYLPAIGIYIALAWAAGELAMRSPMARKATGMAALAVCGVLAFATDHHLRHFESSEALWLRATEVEPTSWIAHNELGNLRYAEGRVEEAIAAYWRAVELEPGEPSIYNDLAWALATNADAALRDPEQALRLARHAAQATSYQDPGYLDTLAASYAAVGRYEAAANWADRGAALADENGEEFLAHIIRQHAFRFREGRALFSDPEEL